MSFIYYVKAFEILIKIVIAHGSHRIVWVTGNFYNEGNKKRF